MRARWAGQELAERGSLLGTGKIVRQGPSSSRPFRCRTDADRDRRTTVNKAYVPPFRPEKGALRLLIRDSHVVGIFPKFVAACLGITLQEFGERFGGLIPMGSRIEW